jgi:hypothetical protein
VCSISEGLPGAPPSTRPDSGRESGRCRGLAAPAVARVWDQRSRAENRSTRLPCWLSARRVASAGETPFPAGPWCADRTPLCTSGGLRLPLPGGGGTTADPFQLREVFHAIPDDHPPPHSPVPGRGHAPDTSGSDPGPGQGPDPPHPRPAGRWIGCPPQPVVVATGGQAGGGGGFSGQHRDPSRRSARRHPPLRLRPPRTGLARS